MLAYGACPQWNGFSP